MGIIMLNGVKYGGSGGSGAGDEYERKPIVLYDGELSSGSISFDLYSHLNYSYYGPRKYITTCIYDHDYSGYAQSQFFKIRIVGHRDYSLFHQDCYIPVLTQQYVDFVWCGQHEWGRVCDSIVGCNIIIYPRDYNNDKLTSYGCINVLLMAGDCLSNYPILNIHMENPNKLNLMRVELL